MAYRTPRRSGGNRRGTRSIGGGYRQSRRTSYSRGRSSAGYGSRAVTINLVTSPGASVAPGPQAGPPVPRRGPRF